ncbi:MAG: ATP-binding protein, partial [Chitinophagales bacterium]
MSHWTSNITDYFLEEYESHSLEVQKKSRYIFFTAIMMVVVMVVSIPLHIFEGGGVFKYAGDITGAIGGILALYFIRKKQISISAYLLIISTVALIVIHNIVNDFLSPNQFHYLRLYVTLSQLFLIYLLLGLFAFKRKHIGSYIFAAIVVLGAHFVVIAVKSYGGFANVEPEMWVAYIVGNIGVIGCGYISYLIFALSEELIEVAEKEAGTAKQQNEELENIVAARTVELQHTNEDLRQFSYVASHDLKEPLRMVSSFLGLIEKRLNGKVKEDQELKEFINYAVDGTQRMDVLINDLLSYSRVNTHQKPFEKVNLNEVLDVAKINLKVYLEENNAIINAKKLPTVKADLNQMIQLFQNLISNAVKYRSKDTIPVINISSDRVDGKVRVSVTDNGIGIAPEYHERIFQVFQR